MKELNTVDLRNQWEPLSTPELEALLQTELERKQPDDEKVMQYAIEAKAFVKQILDDMDV